MKKGDKVTCENGHHICTAARDLYDGQEQEAAKDWEDWQQPMPAIGTRLPIFCTVCQSPWVRRSPNTGYQVHTENGWWP